MPEYSQEEVAALMGRMWAAADRAGVSREAVSFEWPECHKPKCQASHGSPDTAMVYMKLAIMAEIQRELRFRSTTRPDAAPEEFSLEEAAAFHLAILLRTHNVHDEGTYIRAAERIVEAFPELVPALAANTPAGVSIAGLPPTATAPAGSSDHDPRCISLTDGEYNRHCDCELLRTLDAGGSA